MNEVPPLRPDDLLAAAARIAAHATVTPVLPARALDALVLQVVMKVVQ